MKLILMAIGVACCITACNTIKVHQHTIPCGEHTRADVVRSAMSLLVMHGFNITLADTVVGLIQGESAEESSFWAGSVSKKIWQITIKVNQTAGNVYAGAATGGMGDQQSATLQSSLNYHVAATAKVVTKTTNAFGATLSTTEVYCNNDTLPGEEWYWSVRHGLESLCGSVSVITTKIL